jgi:uncharacterized protein RhaS with RHS repeats
MTMHPKKLKNVLMLDAQARSYVWHHQYDELGNRIRTVRPDGHAIDWLTYGSGHVHGRALDGEERIQFERDGLHRETRRTFGSRLGHQTVYDLAGRVIQTALQREQAPMPIVDRRYRYDAAGQLTQMVAYNYIIGSSKRSRPGVDKMTIGDLDCNKVLSDAGI